MSVPEGCKDLPAVCVGGFAIRYLVVKEPTMPKGYWITVYRSVSNPAALAEYGRIAGPAIQEAGGRFLVRGVAAKAAESGKAERTVVIEFDSLAKAVAAYESPTYQAAAKLLAGAVERDVRFVEGLP
jgi:uncharacterized protein (DUF1330 family)